jgi:hypothetical protein
VKAVGIRSHVFAAMAGGLGEGALLVAHELEEAS